MIANKKKFVRPQPKAKTAGYEPIWHAWWNRVRDLPPFSFHVIRYMLIDSQIRLNLSARAAPLSGIEWAYHDGADEAGKPVYKPGIRASSPEVSRFVEMMLRRVWATSLDHLTSAQAWGWAGGEIVYGRDIDGNVVIDRLEGRQAFDVRLMLNRSGDPAGVEVRRVRGSEKGAVRLPFPYGFFHNHAPDAGERYGSSILLGAYSPWADKWLSGGALDVRRLFAHKDAYGGVDIAYPPGETQIGDSPLPTPNVDIAKQMGEQIAAGGVTTRPSGTDDSGNELWRIERATIPANPSHIFEYPEKLDKEMRHGMEIPDDVIDNDGTGAWAGVRIPMAAFYAGLDGWARCICRDLSSQSLEWLVETNFGRDAWFLIEHKPLAMQAMEQQQAAAPGQDGGEAPGEPGGDPMAELLGGGGEPARMSLNPVEAVGDGVISASKILRAAQTLLDDSDAEDADYELTDERIEAMASLLAAVYGDDAPDMLESVTLPKRLATWNPADHPRGPDGRFIKRGTDEAYGIAKSKVDDAHKAKTPESMADLMGHMNTLTVSQLHQLRRDFGVKGSAATKAALIEKLSGRLTSGRHRLERRENDTPVAPVREEVYSVPTDSLNVDPSRFQYKVKGIGEGGVGEELKGTSKWNPELGGTLLVWRDPENGRDYVVNGHHRYELATRTGTDEMNVRYIESPNAKSARAKGALANIAEGRGTALDAAKYLRDSDRDIDHLRDSGVSMSGRVAADAVTLTALADAPFQRVTQGTLEEDKAIAVAKYLPDHDLQEKLFRRLERREDDGKDWSLREISQAARKMAKAGSVKQTGTDLFGDWESEESTFDQEVEIESYIGRQLTREANDFGAVANTRRAKRVSEAGNTLATDENAKRRDAAREIHFDFERESGLRGEVSEAVKGFAAQLAKAKRRKDRDKIKAESLEAIRDLLAPQSAIDQVGSQESGDMVSGLQQLLKKAPKDRGWEGALAMSLRKQYGKDPGEWSLTDEEAEEVEAGARKLLKMLSGSPVKRMAAARAPKGGVTLQGRFYPGGKFIPGVSQDEVDAAAAGGGDAPQKPRRKGKAVGKTAKGIRKAKREKQAAKAPPKQSQPPEKPDAKPTADEATTPPPPGKPFHPDVDKGESARVGVPGKVVPPPPPIGRLPNLTARERKVESRFMAYFEANPEAVTSRALDMVHNSDKPYTFEADAMKMLSDDWVDDDLETQMTKRATNNLALHQVANAIAKRAFLKHLDGLKKGDKVLVTVGGCGAGKGFTLGHSERGQTLAADSQAVWDSAGDQNATENAWIQDEAEKRGLKCTYAFVSADPKVSWADPGRGVVTRAHDTKDGRMVDAAVFADSYAVGARNHHAFHQANKDNPNAEFLFFRSGEPDLLPGVPEEDLSRNRKALYYWAMDSIRSRDDVSPSVKAGGTSGERVWKDEY